jgi:hypothetical protein
VQAQVRIVGHPRRSDPTAGPAQSTRRRPRKVTHAKNATDRGKETGIYASFSSGAFRKFAGSVQNKDHLAYFRFSREFSAIKN